MMSDSTKHPRPDQLLHLLRADYLRRLARFALIDEVPAPWGLGAPVPATMEPTTVEQTDD
jgi:hypothetical protein